MNRIAAGATGRAAGGPAARGTVVQRARAALLGAASALACRLPEGPLVRLAELAGTIWYRAAPRRAAQARLNLGRVTAWLAASGTGSPRARAAAGDPARVEELVRDAFRHHCRYYLEILRAPGLDPSVFDERLVVETPDVVEASFAGNRPTIFVSPHLGPIELPGLYLAHRSGRRVVAPMETVGDPALQGWFERTRAGFGVRIVTLREARRELLGALRRGESVGLVADRDIAGGGIAVPLFGAPAPLPVGPALLATEADAPIYAAGVWRTGRRGLRGRLVAVPVAREGSRRERIAATLAAEAAAFEQLVGNAPEQWGAVFFPIWADLTADAAPRPAGPGTAGGR